MNDDRIIPNEISKEMICSIANLAALGVDGIEKTYMSLKNVMLDALTHATIAEGVRVTEKADGKY